MYKINEIKKNNLDFFSNSNQESSNKTKFTNDLNEYNNNQSEILIIEPEKSVTGYVYDFKVSKPPLDQMENYIQNLKNSNIPVGQKFKDLCYILGTSKPERTISEKEGVHSFIIDNENTKHYNLIRDLAVQQRGEGYNGARGSCAQAVCHVITLLYDQEFPSANPLAQYNYLNSKDNNKWECIYKNLENEDDWPSDLQEGDIIISVNKDVVGGHTMIYVGEDNGTPLFYEAAYYQQDDGLYSSTYPVIDKIEKVSNKKGRTTFIYRAKNNI